MMKSHIEIYLNGEWVTAAVLESAGDDACYFSYLPEYVFSDQAVGLSLNLPATLDGRTGKCPAFLYDLVPQGRGRKFLVSKLALNDHDALVMPLIQNGAFNPIGRLRIDTAKKFFDENMQERTSVGFALEDIVNNEEAFIDYLDQFGMLGGGTTGIQGVAPKFLLSIDRDGLWHVDSLLSDQNVGSHWIAKKARGKTDIDQLILRSEAAYMHIAGECGLRTQGDAACVMHNDMLFVKRFDREVVDGRVVRLHQESLASLAGYQGFGMRANHFDLLAAMIPHVTDPLAETLEYIKRDILNQALRNTDNHARNTAVQITQGNVQLTPLYDFAPMFMDSEMIPRSTRWLKEGQNELSDWNEVVSLIDLDDELKPALLSSLKDFLQHVERLPELMRHAVDKSLAEQCMKSIEKQCTLLSKLSGATLEMKASVPEG